MPGPIMFLEQSPEGWWVYVNAPKFGFPWVGPFSSEKKALCHVKALEKRYREKAEVFKLEVTEVS